MKYFSTNGDDMHISFIFFLLILALPISWIPFVGKKWSAILSYVLFGWLFGLGLVVGYSGLSEPPAGPSHDWARVYLLVAAFSAVMLLATIFVYRKRQQKAAKRSASINQ